MTFNTAALAIDGARVTSSLVRLGTYASTGGAQGVVAAPDLKVSPLTIAGNGFQIAPGGALVLNDYQTNPTQTYVVENSGPHVFGSESMPAVDGATRYFIAAIVIGDQEYDQVGHPFMPSDEIPEEDREDFVYVRPVLFPVADSGVKALPYKGYPVLELAQIRIKAGSATIDASDIVDLRDLARPRTQEAIAHVQAPNNGNGLNNPGTWEKWPNVNVIQVRVPEWASTAIISGFIEGVKQSKAGAGAVRAAISGTALVTENTDIDETAPKNALDRKSYNIGGSMNVVSKRGQLVTFITQGASVGAGSANFLTTDAATSVMLRVLFQEALI